MVQTRGDLFTPERIAGMISDVQGRSSLAVLSQQKPMAFNGNEQFHFTMDSEIDIVDESGAKTAGGVTITKTRMDPIKVEYSARFSEEMWMSGEEAQLNIIRTFMDGYAKKLARGLDLMALHGINPRSGQLSTSPKVTENYFDALVDQTVEYDALKVDDSLEDAIFMVTGAGGRNTGIVMSTTAGRDLSKVEVNGVRQYPEFRMGATPGVFAGVKNEINETVSAFGNTEIYVGDFENQFRWGYAKEMPLEIHTAGNPDNSSPARDLAGHNEIMLRSETYLGWGILNPASFARVIDTV